MSLQQQQTQQLKQDRKIICRIIEAKSLNVDKGKTCDVYAIAALDKKEERTPTIFNNQNPFWSEEFTFEDFEADFGLLSVLVKNKVTDDSFGQVLFPKALLTSGQLEEEQWFVLAPVDIENSVSGDIRVKIAYFPPKNDIRTHTFAVNVVSGRNLAPRSSNGSSNPYVALHLLPDLRVKSTQLTGVHIGTLSPEFRETFIYAVDELRADSELHISVWNSVHDDKPSNEDIFMGHSSIPLGDVKTGAKIERWYTLLPKPGHIENLSVLLEKRKKRRKSADAMTKPKMFALALQTSDLDAAVSSKSQKSPHKFIDIKLNSLSYCGHCSGILWAESSQMQCKNCRLNCHSKCAKFISNRCGFVGMIRLKIKYSTTPILPIQKYERLIDILSEEEFAIPTLLGRVIQEREDAARHLIRIFDTRFRVEDFLKGLITNEVSSAADSQTLFRANSMASKAIDVFMKHVGMTYLKKVIGPIINIIVLSDKSCEVDPTRLEKKEDINLNWKTFISYFEATLHAIFGNVELIPSNLRVVFAHLQQEVVKRFPNDQTVKYTAVGGFIFLRFIAPAILGPKLFKLMDEYAEMRAARTFTLLAKSVQNLANLVEFGQKEPFMSNINTLMQANFQNMKCFIDQISTVEAEKCPRSSVRMSSFPEAVNLGRECARISEILLKSSEKLIEGTKDNEKQVVSHLMAELIELSKALEDNQSTELSNRISLKASNTAEESLPSGVFREQDASHLPSDTSSEPAFSAVMMNSKSNTDDAESNLIHAVKELDEIQVEESKGRKDLSDSPAPTISRNLEQRKSTGTHINFNDRTRTFGVIPAVNSDDDTVDNLKEGSSAISKRETSLSIETNEIGESRETAGENGGSILSGSSTLSYSKMRPATRVSASSAISLLSVPGAELLRASTLRPTRMDPMTRVVQTKSMIMESSPVYSMPSVSSMKVEDMKKKEHDEDSELDEMMKTLNSLSSDFSNVPTPKLVVTTQSSNSTVEKKEIDAQTSRKSSASQQQALSQLLNAANSLMDAVDSTFATPDPSRPSSLMYENPKKEAKQPSTSPPRSPLADKPPLSFPTKDLAYPPSTKICYECEEPIFDGLIEACDKTWHRNCFQCTDCGILLVSNYVPYDNMPYCKQDYLKRAGLICGVCGEYIETAYIDVLNRKYHVDCKKCSACGKILAGKHYFSLNGQTFCSEHRETFMNCHACKIPIVGQVLVALKKQYQYHPEHFNCYSCKKNLASTHFFERDETPFCQQCFYKTTIMFLQKPKVAVAAPLRPS